MVPSQYALISGVVSLLDSTCVVSRHESTYVATDTGKFYYFKYVLNGAYYFPNDTDLFEFDFTTGWVDCSR